MIFLKADKYWIVLETGEHIPYGGVAIDFYVNTKRHIKKYWDECSELRHLYKTESEREKALDVLKNKYGFNEYDYEATEIALQIIEFYFDENAIIKTDENESELLSEKMKINNQSFIELIKKNGWKDFPKNYKVPLLDAYFLKNVDGFEVKHTLRYYKYEWYPAYDIDNHDTLIMVIYMDLMEMRKYNYHFRRCRHCFSLFLQKNSKIKYCPDCSKQYKKIKDEERNDTPRGQHKRIYNYLNNSGKFDQKEIDLFMEESNYYWDLLNGKDIKINSNYQSIKSTDDYMQWLLSKHNEYKEIAKSRKIMQIITNQI